MEIYFQSFHLNHFTVITENIFIDVWCSLLGRSATDGDIYNFLFAKMFLLSLICHLPYAFDLSQDFLRAAFSASFLQRNQIKYCRSYCFPVNRQTSQATFCLGSIVEPIKSTSSTAVCIFDKLGLCHLWFQVSDYACVYFS